MEIWIEENLLSSYPNLIFHFNERKILDGLELDIYIPSLQLAFELNGIFHYEPIFGKEKLDKKKILFCKNKKIKLFVLNTSKITYFKPNKAYSFLEEIKSIINSNLAVS